MNCFSTGRLNSYNDFTFLLGGGASLSSGVMSPEDLALEWFHILRKYMYAQFPPPADSDYVWVSEILKDESKWDAFRNPEKNAYRIALVMTNRDKNDWFKLASFVIAGISKSYFEIATMLAEIHPAGKMIICNTTIKIADKATPSLGYYLLAKLMATPRNVQTHKTIRHDAVITTNFDEMLRQGFIYLRNVEKSMCTSLTNPQCITVSDDPVQLSVIDNYLKNRERPLIYHVHNSQDFNPRNTIRDVSYYTPRMNSTLRKLINGRGLLVMGYSGADEGLMTALIDLVEKGYCKRIYWLCYRGNIPDSRPFERLQNVLQNNLLLLNCPAQPINNSYALSCEEGFDSFMLKLFTTLFSPPSFLKGTAIESDRQDDIRTNRIETVFISNIDDINNNLQSVSCAPIENMSVGMKIAEGGGKIKTKKYELVPFAKK